MIHTDMEPTFLLQMFSHSYILLLLKSRKMTRTIKRQEVAWLKLISKKNMIFRIYSALLLNQPLEIYAACLFQEHAYGIIFGYFLSSCE